VTGDTGSSRVGVFLCSCGTNIGGVIDIPHLAEFAKKIPGVVYVEQNLHTCSSEGIAHIKEAIKAHGLERVVVAACTPRTHEPLFMSAVEEAGLNRYLFQMVNIREHDSWVHGRDKESANEKAEYLIRMAVAKARFLEPEEEREVEVTPSTLIVGAGVAGMTAALNLAEKGFQVYLVEKESEPGGLVGKLHTLLPTGQDAQEFLTPMVKAVKGSDKIHLLLGSKVAKVEGSIGSFTVTIQSGANRLSTEVGTIIVATGAEALTPEGYYQYGSNEGIVTQLELEERLRAGSPIPSTVAFIQCVGSMEAKGRTYCSKVCCGVSMKNAVYLKKLESSKDVYILYRDLQASGVELEALYREALEVGVKFVNYIPEKQPTVTVGADRSIHLSVYDTLQGADLELHPGMVVLATPLVQHDEGRELAKALRVPLTQDGFFLEAHPKMRPVDFTSDGVYLCGAAHSPKGVAESITQGLAAASRASIPLTRGFVKAEAVTAVLNPDKCVGCGACASGCAFDAIKWTPMGVPEVIEEACKGCGVCTVECPVGAMQLRYFKDDQLLPAVRAVLEPAPWVGDTHPERPVVLVYACRWCSYAAADFAGVMRLQYPANVRIVLVPCSGRVDFSYIYQGFSSGADGIVVAGCLKDQCHYVDGNILAERRIEAAKKALGVLGVSGERLEMFFCSAGMPRDFAQHMRDFTGKIQNLGRVDRTTQAFTSPKEQEAEVH
jgi:heterodisulfide reductase subunit A